MNDAEELELVWHWYCGEYVPSVTWEVVQRVQARLDNDGRA